jgi:hypothetical protein
MMRWTSRIVMSSMLMMVLPLNSAVATMISTDQVVSQQAGAQDRAKIIAFIERDQVRTQLQSNGVTATQAQARVNALTDDEAHNIAGKLDQLPAGADVLSLLFTVFIVLLVTDILGFTKVFSFTRPIKR